MRFKSNNARAGSFLSALAALTLAACGARAVQPTAPRPDSLRTERVANGVTYEFRWYGNGPWAVYALTIDPRACGIDLRTVKGLDRVVGRETTSSMAARTGARFQRPVLAAVNADFFSFDPPGVSEGPQISNQQLIKSEGTHREAVEDRAVRLRPVFAFTRDRNVWLRHTRLRGTARASTTTLALTGVNVRARGDHVVVFDTLFGDVTPVDTGALEFVLRAARPVTAPFGRTGVVTAVDTAAAGVALPRDGFVLAARGTARAALAGLGMGDTVTWQAAFDSLPGAISELIGGYPMLLMGGRAVHHDESGLRAAFSDRRHPRVAIGVDQRRRIHIIAVDGRREGFSAGMTLQELGEYLMAHGVRDALNFDGGGSTTVVVADRIVNRPSDASGERAVSNALVVLGPPAGACR